MPRKQTSTSLSDLLPKVLQKLSSHPRPSREEIDELWQRLVGKQAAHYSWPRRLVRGRLIVEVENSGWMFTLNQKRMELLQGLVQSLGKEVIQSLSFRIGERKDV